MRFISCGSSDKSKQSAYQARTRISSHYSTIALAIANSSKEVLLKSSRCCGSAFSGTIFMDTRVFYLSEVFARLIFGANLVQMAGCANDTPHFLTSAR